MFGGEGLDDPNFDFTNAETVQQKLEQWYSFVQDYYHPSSDEKELNRSDKIFVSAIHRYLKEGTEAMELMNFRSGFDRLFFQMQRVLKEYLKRGEPNQAVVNYFIECQIPLLSPFCPHLAEELWEKIGKKGFVSFASWPASDPSKIDLKLEETEKVVDKTVSDVMNVLKLVKEKSGKEGQTIYLYVMPQELSFFDAAVMTRRVGKEVKVFAVNDKNKHDPEGKAAKAKPGKP